MIRPTPKEILELIKKLPNTDKHIVICPINKKPCVTSEFLTGNFSGRSFEADSYEKAAKKLINYFYKHIGHDSMVGKNVTESGFPNLKEVYEYCKLVTIENTENEYAC